MLGSAVLKCIKSASCLWAQSRPVSHSSSQRRRRGAYRSHFGIESLEDRRLLANYTWNEVANTLSISLATEEDLTVAVAAGQVSFTLSAGNFTQVNGTAAPGSGTPTITIAVADLASSITIDNITAANGSNNVTFNGAGSITTGIVDVDLTRIATTNTIAFTGGFDLTTNGKIELETTRNITLGVGTTLANSGADGIKLSANRQIAATPGDFVGIELNRATLTTSDAGDILLEGRGGSTGDNNYGILLRNSALVESISTDADAGSITLNGIGGNGGKESHGILLITEAEIESAVGSIQFTGKGGNGTGNLNVGVILTSDAAISSTGTGANAATIKINGTGGNAVSQNMGVWIAAAQITSVDGAIEITGQGGLATGEKNVGFLLTSAAKIVSTGTGANAASISIKGTGGSGVKRNFGARIGGNSEITSPTGDIKIEGQGGNGTAAGALNLGTILTSDASVTSSGAIAGAATISIKGTGGSGSSRNSGVWIGDGVEVKSQLGAISIAGTGGLGTGTLNMGVFLTTGAQVVSTGTGSSAANIGITGIGKGMGSASHRNDGIRIRGTTTKIKSVDGDITITGDSGTGTSVDIKLLTANNINITGTGKDTFVGTVVAPS